MASLVTRIGAAILLPLLATRQVADASLSKINRDLTTQAKPSSISDFSSIRSIFPPENIIIEEPKYVSIDTKTLRVEVNKAEIEKALKEGKIDRKDIENMLVGYYKIIAQSHGEKPPTYEEIDKGISTVSTNREKLEHHLVLNYIQQQEGTLNYSISKTKKSVHVPEITKGNRGLFLGFEHIEVLELTPLAKLGFPYVLGMDSNYDISSVSIIDYKENPEDSAPKKYIRIRVLHINQRDSLGLSVFSSVLVPINMKVAVMKVSLNYEDGTQVKEYHYVDASKVADARTKK